MISNINTKLQKNYFRVLGYIYFLINIALYFKQVLFKFEKYLDSDVSSELILGHMVAQRGSLIFCEDWYYSTSLRVIDIHVIFGLLFRLIDSYKYVRFIGSILIITLLFIATYILLRTVDLVSAFPFIAGSFLIPFSAEYVWIMLTGLWYVSYAFVSFFIISLVLSYSKSCTKRDSLIIFSIMAILSLMTGLAGSRYILIMSAPLVVSSFLFWLISKYSKYNFNSTIAPLKLLFVSVSEFCFTLVGCAINSLYLSKIFHFTNYQDINWISFSFTRFENIINTILYALGYSYDKPLFSTSSILNFGAWFILLLIIFSIIILTKSQNWNGLQFFLALLGVVDLSISIGLFLLTDMDLYARYIITAICFFPFIIAIATMSILQSKYFEKTVFVSGLCIILLTISSIQYINHTGMNEEDAVILSNVANFLVDNDYNNGYATYWNGNILQELSNGKIEVWTLDNGDDDIISTDQIFHFLQDKSHTVKNPSERVFILFNNQEDNFIIGRYLPKSNLVFEDSGYLVYGFDSYEDMLCECPCLSILPGTNEIPLNSDYFYSDCINDQGEYISNNEGNTLLCGPKMPVKQGLYDVIISYSCIDPLPSDIAIGQISVYDEDMGHERREKYILPLFSNDDMITVPNVEITENVQEFTILLDTVVSGVKINGVKIIRK